MPNSPGQHRARSWLLAVALACLFLLTASGCGGAGEKFSQGEASRALDALDSLQADIDDGRCQDAARQVNRLAVQSTHVNEDRQQLGEAWASSVARLNQLVVRECIEITPTGPTPTTTTDSGPTTTGPTEPAKPTKPDGGNPPDNGGQTPGGQNGGQNGGAGGGDTTPPDNGNGGNSQPPADSGGAGPGA